ncbi:MAG: DUF2062 domain-containing protein [Sideroxydans sp.]|nr:DUF2062 domain-containing protein [Sideroxydans sp.]
MRKFFKHRLPNRESIRQIRWLQPVHHWLVHPNLWHLHRRSVAGGVAVGLFCGLIPGPLQMISAALLAVLFRVNLPVAMFTTLYTNPFTIVPLYVLAYEIGALVIGNGTAHIAPAFPDWQWSDGYAPMLNWLLQLGEPLLVGLPLLALGLALIGYVVVRLAWRAVVVWKWRRRQRR